MTGIFSGNRISANRGSTTGFSIGNNAKVSFSGNNIDGATFSTLFSIGTGVILNIGPQTYGTVTTFLSGSPAAGSRVVDNSGNITDYGAYKANNSFQVGSSQAFTGALGNGLQILSNNSVYNYTTGCSGTATSSATLFMEVPGIVPTCTDTAGAIPFVLAAGNPPFPVYNALDCTAGTGGKVSSSGVVTLQLNSGGGFADTALTCTFGTGSICADFTHSVTSGGTGEKIRVKYTTQAAETLANISCSFQRQ